MYKPTPQGELRPSVTPDNPYAEPLTIPLLRLRSHDRPIIQPAESRVTDCLVCAWRRAGLLDHPTPRVVRDHAASYGMCHSSHCPGCNAVRCVCPPAGYEDAIAEATYALGHEHGEADGADNRPTIEWLVNAGLDAESYWQGYDDACSGLPLGMPAEPLPEQPRAPVLWDELDDGLPF